MTLDCQCAERGQRNLLHGLCTHQNSICPELESAGSGVFRRGLESAGTKRTWVQIRECWLGLITGRDSESAFERARVKEEREEEDKMGKNGTKREDLQGS